jgi:hypothetical protein
MPGLVPASTSLLQHSKEDVDGRDKPGHDECGDALSRFRPVQRIDRHDADRP